MLHTVPDMAQMVTQPLLAAPHSKEISEWYLRSSPWIPHLTALTLVWTTADANPQFLLPHRTPCFSHFCQTPWRPLAHWQDPSTLAQFLVLLYPTASNNPGNSKLELLCSVLWKRMDSARAPRVATGKLLNLEFLSYQMKIVMHLLPKVSVKINRSMCKAFKEG